jgi:SAM-dependent methyltransferase
MPQQEALDEAGYGLCHQVNLDDSDSLARLIGQLHNQYDAIILLHVLEHLNKPERAIMFLSAVLKADGIVLGGFPVLPSGIARLRERQLQNSAQPFGHITAFSPRRVRKMAERAGLSVDYASGAFAVRASGSPLEHSSRWLRLNIAFGAMFPGWPGEIYWQLRKSSADK